MPAETVVHGKPTLVHHDGQGVYDGLDGPMVAGRYHSLVVSDEGLPPELVVTARTGSGVVMGLRHREYPVEGVQFHPESILSQQGHQLLGTFLDSCLAVVAYRGLRGLGIDPAKDQGRKAEPARSRAPSVAGTTP